MFEISVNIDISDVSEILKKISVDILTKMSIEIKMV